MGLVDGDGKRSLDLHALHVPEEKHMLVEYVFPAISDVKRVILITGRGTLSKGGKGEILMFVREHGYVYIIREGALLVSLIQIILTEFSLSLQTHTLISTPAQVFDYGTSPQSPDFCISTRPAYRNHRPD